MSSTLPPTASTSRAGLAAWRQVACSGGAALARALWLVLRQPSQLWFALSTPWKLARHRRQLAAPRTLRALSPGVWRAPQQGEPPEEQEPLVVLQYTGTGESVHAAYENTRALFAGVPALTGAAHYVFEAPLDKGAYYGPEAFGASMWQRVEPIVQHYAGPFVLLGVSRGGLVALDHGARIAEEHGKVASVLSLSAPIIRPSHIPTIIDGISGFVESLEGIAQALPGVARHVRASTEALVRFFYLVLIALILRFHRVFDLASLDRHALDVGDHGVVSATVRCAREFRLLVRASERKLQLHTQLVQQALVRHRQRFFACLVWGAEDGWIDADTCLARFVETAGKLAVAPDAEACVVAGLGHLLAADDPAIQRTLRPYLTRVAGEACRLGQLDDPEEVAARHVQNELHLASESRHKE
jgi:pimeloyl-ACP methyl ester carboxylesterase